MGARRPGLRPARVAAPRTGGHRPDARGGARPTLVPRPGHHRRVAGRPDASPSIAGLSLAVAITVSRTTERAPLSLGRRQPGRFPSWPSLHSSESGSASARRRSSSRPCSASSRSSSSASIPSAPPIARPRSTPRAVWGRRGIWIWRHVTFPAALPALLSGLKLAAVFAVTGRRGRGVHRHRSGAWLPLGARDRPVRDRRRPSRRVVVAGRNRARLLRRSSQLLERLLVTLSLSGGKTAQRRSSAPNDRHTQPAARSRSHSLPLALVIAAAVCAATRTNHLPTSSRGALRSSWIGSRMPITPASTRLRDAGSFLGRRSLDVRSSPCRVTPAAALKQVGNGQRGVRRSPTSRRYSSRDLTGIPGQGRGGRGCVTHPLNSVIVAERCAASARPRDLEGKTVGATGLPSGRARSSRPSSEPTAETRTRCKIANGRVHAGTGDRQPGGSTP